MVYDEENAIFIGDIEVENLATVPENAFEFMGVQGRMPPIRGKEGKFGASGAFDFRRKILKLLLEANRAAKGHNSSTVASIAMYSRGSMASSMCALQSATSLAVGLREGTVAAKSTGSKGT